MTRMTQEDFLDWLYMGYDSEGLRAITRLSEAQIFDQLTRDIFLDDGTLIPMDPGTGEPDCTAAELKTAIRSILN
jgi:hypothetical protein